MYWTDLGIRKIQGVNLDGTGHPLLSDHPDLTVARSYGVVQHYPLEPRLVGRRAFFLIDKQGIVRGRWLPANQLATFPNEPIIEKIREIGGTS